jgi:hypothetical protein
MMAILRILEPKIGRSFVEKCGEELLPAEQLLLYYAARVPPGKL